MALNNVQAILLAQVNRLQELEDAIWTLLTPLSDKTFASVTGKLLEFLGAIVGESRDGRADADYQAAIRIRIRVNRSRGKAEDVIAVAKLAAIHSTPSYTEPNDDGPIFEVDITNLPGAATVARLLGEAKPLGVTGLLVATADATDHATWGDSTQPTVHTTAQLWGDSVSATGPKWGTGFRLTST